VNHLYDVNFVLIPSFALVKQSLITYYLHIVCRALKNSRKKVLYVKCTKEVAPVPSI